MSKDIRIIVAGSRSFNDYELMRTALMNYFFGIKLTKEDCVTIISGGAKGADLLGEEFAKNNHFNLCRFPADWDKHGKSAGIIRNCEMAKYAKEGMGVLFAFWDGKSRGTNHMITYAEKIGLEVHIFKQ